MKKRDFTSNVFLLRSFFFLLLLLPLDSYGCPDAFGGRNKVKPTTPFLPFVENTLPTTTKKNNIGQHLIRRTPSRRKKISSQGPSLFDIQPPAKTLIGKDQAPVENTSPDTNLSIVKNTQRKTSSPKPKTRRQTKIDITHRFLESFESRDFEQMEKLVKESPFLTSLRLDIDSPFVTNYIKNPKTLALFPEGISLPHIAVYSRDLQKLSRLLKMGFKIRTIKQKKKGSIEPNPLHVAITENLYTEAETILKHEGYVSPGEKGRLIDEKNQDTLTPLALAIERDIHNRGYPYFTRLIGRYRPSGYVEFFINGERMDGVILVEETKHPEIKKIGKRYVWAPNYVKYKGKKMLHGKRASPPSH